MDPVKKPKVRFTYCTQCNWMLRTAWMAQELLQTFGQDIAEVTLVPSTGGIYQIELDGVLIWDRKQNGGFPDAKTIKKIIRDHVWPERDLGHVDRANTPD